MPKINEMLLELEGFLYATLIDLNIGYYHIRLRKTQITYVRSLSHGGNIVTSIYQRELIIHKAFSNRI